MPSLQNFTNPILNFPVTFANLIHIIPRKDTHTTLFTKAWQIQNIYIYIYIFIRQKGSSNKWKKHQTHNNKNKQTKERENYAQIGRASEQCYHQRTLKTSVNQR